MDHVSSGSAEQQDEEGFNDIEAPVLSGLNSGSQSKKSLVEVTSKETLQPESATNRSKPPTSGRSKSDVIMSTTTVTCKSALMQIDLTSNQITLEAYKMIWTLLELNETMSIIFDSP